MNKNSGRTNSCCSPRLPDVMYIYVGPEKRRSGMRNLDEVFNELYQLEREPSQVKNKELIEITRKYNYISRKPAIEDDYAEALREAYTKYWNNRKQTPEQSGDEN